VHSTLPICAKRDSWLNWRCRSAHPYFSQFFKNVTVAYAIFLCLQKVMTYTLSKHFSAFPLVLNSINIRYSFRIRIKSGFVIKTSPRPTTFACSSPSTKLLLLITLINTRARYANIRNVWSDWRSHDRTNSVGTHYSGLIPGFCFFFVFIFCVSLRCVFFMVFISFIVCRPSDRYIYCKTPLHSSNIDCLPPLLLNWGGKDENREQGKIP